MTLLFTNEQDHALLTALGLSTGRFSRVNRNIHAEDEMLLHYANLHPGNPDLPFVLYFDSGRRIWETLRMLLRWRFGEPGPDFQLLDFASGYGRMMRYAAAEIPPERIWVSDIYAGGVRFQEEQFGVHGILSQPDPERFECAETFDAIFVCSLFTHLPEVTFRAWLRRLYGLLRPGGMLAFSVHGEDLAPAGREMPASGILFDRKSESGSLPVEQYGTSWVTDAFVRRVLQEVAPGSSAHRIRRGILQFQDLYVVVPEAGGDFSGLPLDAEPEGFVEHCSVYAGRLRLSGWAVHRLRPEPPRELRVALDGEVRHRRQEFHPREDAKALFPYEQVSPWGWYVEIPLAEPDLERNSPLALEVEYPGEAPLRFYEDTLKDALLRTTRLDLHTLQRQLLDSAALHQREIGARDEKIQELESRIAAMKASRFWKMRRAWFRVKRAVGLTEES